ncbi:MAG: recombinase family protein [Phycisphaerae bacterium]|nr:recombinase family protein [Phycisphaerae bacterium]
MIAAKPCRCALYLRVSPGPQAKDNSLTTQRSQLLAYAKERGYSVTDIYMDVGLSGKNTKRPELQRLLSDAMGQKFDIVLVWKLDRISRSLRDLIGLLWTLREANVEFAAIDQQFDTSDPAGLLTMHVLGSFAQFERELIVERTKQGHLRRLKRSDWSCGVVPLGYRKENGRLIEVPAEAKLVGRIFQLYLKLGSLRAVANTLNGEGVKTRKGKAWSGNTIGYLLSNPVYAGANVYGRHASGDTRLKDKAEWNIVPNTRKPMVKLEAFEAVQKLLAGSRGRSKGKHDRESYPLSGQLKCPKCGSSMHGKTDRQGEKVHRYYVCNGNAHKGSAFCEGYSVRADVAEKELTGKEDSRRPGAQPKAGGPSDAEDKTASESKNGMARDKYRLVKLLELYEIGGLDKETFRTRLATMA